MNKIPLVEICTVSDCSDCLARVRFAILKLAYIEAARSLSSSQQRRLY